MNKAFEILTRLANAIPARVGLSSVRRRPRKAVEDDWIYSAMKYSVPNNVVDNLDEMLRWDIWNKPCCSIDEIAAVRKSLAVKRS